MRPTNHFHTTTCEKHAQPNQLTVNHRPRATPRNASPVWCPIWHKAHQPGHRGRMPGIHGVASTGTASRGFRARARHHADGMVPTVERLADSSALPNQQSLGRAGKRCPGSDAGKRIVAAA